MKKSCFGLEILNFWHFKPFHELKKMWHHRSLWSLSPPIPDSPPNLCILPYFLVLLFTIYAQNLLEKLTDKKNLNYNYMLVVGEYEHAHWPGVGIIWGIIDCYNSGIFNFDFCFGHLEHAMKLDWHLYVCD